MFKPALASLLLVGALPASAALFTDDLSAFSSSITSFSQGSAAGQVIGTSVGGSSGTVSGIGGNSIFMTIDTSAVTNLTTAPAFGGGLRFTATDAFNGGNLNSSDPTDYDVVFDIAASGFSPSNFDLFLNPRNSSNGNVLPNQLSINQNTPSFQPFFALLQTTDGPVSVSIPLEDFAGAPANVSGLALADRFQFQINTRAPGANYTADSPSTTDASSNVLVLDNIGFNVVPEPASAALLAGGALCLIARRRRTA